MKYILLLILIATVLAAAEEKAKSDIERQAEQIGVSIHTLTKAVKTDVPGALAVYLALSIDGAGGEVFHCDDRPSVLRGISDDRLAAALREFSAEKIVEIGRELRCDLRPEEVPEVEKRFPKTLKLVGAAARPNKSE